MLMPARATSTSRCLTASSRAPSGMTRNVESAEMNPATMFQTSMSSPSGAPSDAITCGGKCATPTISGSSLALALDACATRIAAAIRWPKPRASARGKGGRNAHSHHRPTVAGTNWRGGVTLTVGQSVLVQNCFQSTMYGALPKSFAAWRSVHLDALGSRTSAIRGPSSSGRLRKGSSRAGDGVSRHSKPRRLSGCAPLQGRSAERASTQRWRRGRLPRSLSHSAWEQACRPLAGCARIDRDLQCIPLGVQRRLDRERASAARHDVPAGSSLLRAWPRRSPRAARWKSVHDVSFRR